MKLHPEDPRLTAYLLGELTADEAAAVEHAVAADPALQAAVRELENVQHLLTDTLAPKTVALLPGQRESIRRAAKSDKITPLNVRRKSWKPWLLPLAVAAVITLIAVISAQKPGRLKQVCHSPPPESIQSESSTPEHQTASRAGTGRSGKIHRRQFRRPLR